MTRYIKRGGKVWIKIFPDKPVTTKPAETRMGSGKGTLEYWVAVVKPGRVMFEIAGVSEEVAREALRLATHKLPCKCINFHCYHRLLSLREKLLYIYMAACELQDEEPLSQLLPEKTVKEGDR